MFDAAAPRRTAAAAVAQQLAATLAHVVIGRVVALVVLEGRAWDTGLENLWVHVDSEGAIDWVGVVDPTLRVLPDDPCFSGTRAPVGETDRRAAQRGGADDVDRPPQSPRPGAAVRRAARRQRRRGDDGVDVAHRGIGHRRARQPRCRCWPGRAKWSACAAGRRCSTRSSASALPVRGQFTDAPGEHRCGKRKVLLN